MRGDPYRNDNDLGILSWAFMPFYVFESITVPYLRTNIGHYYISPERRLIGFIGTVAFSFFFLTPLSGFWWLLFIVFSIYARWFKTLKKKEHHSKYVGDSIIFLKFIMPRLNVSDAELSRRHRRFRDYLEPLLFTAITGGIFIIEYMMGKYVYSPLFYYCVIWSVITIIGSYVADFEEGRAEVLLHDANIERMDDEKKLRNTQTDIAESMGGDSEEDWDDEEYIAS